MTITKMLVQILQTIGTRAFSALWFGLTALMITLPFVLLLYPWDSESISNEQKLMALEFFIPVVMAIVTGAILGPPILNKDILISDYQAFVIAVRISMITGVLSLLTHIFASAFFDLERAPIVLFLLFGAPFYGVIAGLSGFGLRAIGNLQT